VRGMGFEPMFIGKMPMPLKKRRFSTAE